MGEYHAAARKIIETMGVPWNENLERTIAHHFQLYESYLNFTPVTRLSEAHVSSLATAYKEMGVRPLSPVQLVRFMNDPKDFVSHMGFTPARAADYALENLHPEIPKGTQEHEEKHDAILKQFYYISQITVEGIIGGEYQLTKQFVMNMVEYWKHCQKGMRLGPAEYREICDDPASFIKRVNTVYSVKDVESMLHVSRQSVLHWMNRGWLPYEMFGKDRKPIRPEVDKLHAYLRENVPDGSKPDAMFFSRYFTENNGAFLHVKNKEDNGKKIESLSSKIAKLEEKISCEKEKASQKSKELQYALKRTTELSSEISEAEKRITELSSNVSELETRLREEREKYVKMETVSDNAQKTIAALLSENSEMKKELMEIQEKPLNQEPVRHTIDYANSPMIEFAIERLKAAHTRSSDFAFCLESAVQMIYEMQADYDKIVKESWDECQKSDDTFARKAAELEKRIEDISTALSEKIKKDPFISTIKRLLSEGRLDTLTSKSYDKNHTYKEGEFFFHPDYGKGFVVVVKNSTIVTQFRKRIAVLQHNTGDC